MFPVIIVGMARSGTTLVSHILGSLPNVHIEVEPHALWKSGNFKYFNDEEYDMTPEIIENIRQKFTSKLNGKTLVEKSPINSLRADLVHAVFPEAKIIYLERDPVRCIYSNYNRSLKKDSFKLSIALKKYFLYTGSRDLSGAISERGLFQQISVKDVPYIVPYATKMFYLRQFRNLPFGPKIKNFMQIVEQKGLLAYHVEVYKKSLEYKSHYKKLFGNNLREFKFENIISNSNEMEELAAFTGIAYSSEFLNKIRSSFDKERVNLSTQKHSIDKQIEQLLIQN